MIREEAVQPNSKGNNIEINEFQGCLGIKIQGRKAIPKILNSNNVNGSPKIQISRRKQHQEYKVPTSKKEFINKL